MDLTLQILLGIVSLICLLDGMNLLLKGSGSYLPDTVQIPPILDNLFRFLSGIYFGLGFLMTWVVFNFHQISHLIYFIGIVVAFSGLGRLYSKIKVGSAGKNVDNIMLFEIILGVCIVFFNISGRILIKEIYIKKGSLGF
jgi:Domain of unknown function (DUF4345)